MFLLLMEAKQKSKIHTHTHTHTHTRQPYVHYMHPQNILIAMRYPFAFLTRLEINIMDVKIRLTHVSMVANGNHNKRQQQQRNQQQQQQQLFHENGNENPNILNNNSWKMEQVSDSGGPKGIHEQWIRERGYVLTLLTVHCNLPNEIQWIRVKWNENGCAKWQKSNERLAHNNVMRATSINSTSISRRKTKQNQKKSTREKHRFYALQLLSTTKWACENLNEIRIWNTVELANKELHHRKYADAFNLAVERKQSHFWWISPCRCCERATKCSEFFLARQLNCFQPKLECFPYNVAQTKVNSRIGALQWLLLVFFSVEWAYRVFFMMLVHNTS